MAPEQGPVSSLVTYGSLLMAGGAFTNVPTSDCQIDQGGAAETATGQAC